MPALFDGGDRGAAQPHHLHSLGKVAHDSLCRSFGLPVARAKFAHGAEHLLPGGKRLIDSYHCSRYNQNTKRLDAAMFESVFERAVG